MIVNTWLVLDPSGDRPYTTTTPPVHLSREPGVRVFRVETEVPEPVVVDGVLKGNATPATFPTE